MSSIVDFLQEWDRDRQKDLKKTVKEVLTTKEPILYLDPKADLESEQRFARVSKIHNLCPREEFLCSKHKLTRYFEASATLNRTFGMGRAFENYYRDNVLGDMGIVYGKWKCLECGFVLENYKGKAIYPKPLRCARCEQTEGFRYIESVVRHIPLMLQGHIDGFIYWNNELHILELKTANSHFFKSYRYAPKPEHKSQASVYGYLMGIKKAIIWYVNKDTGEEAIHYVDIDYEKIEQTLVVKMEKLVESYYKGLMPSGVCMTSTDERAKKCLVRQQCFGNCL